MQGIETLGYEVVEVPVWKAMVPEEGIPQHQRAAEMLAEFGRNGDTYVVHAAEGETVVPLEVLENNPKLKNMIFAQMEEMGLDPERYVVGNELNSLNPDTGQPEFFFKKLFKAIGKVVKGIVKVVKKIAPVVLAIAAPILLPTMPIALAAGLGSTAGNLIQGKSLGDSLKSGVVTGLTAGAGNMISGGSFLGSSVDPGNVAGLQNLGTMFTPDNPFTAAISPNLTAVGTAVGDLGGEVGSGILKQDFTSGAAAVDAGAAAVDGAGAAVDGAGSDAAAEAAAEAAAKAAADAVAKPKTFMDGLTSAFIPGDDYGFGDFWSEFLSPSRPGLTAEMKPAYQSAMNDWTAANPDLIGGAAHDAFAKNLANDFSSGIFGKYAPMVGVALAGGMASDALLGTEFITPKEEEGTDIAEMQNAGANLLASDFETYGIDSSYANTNPFYTDYPDNPNQTAQVAAANPGFTNPVAVNTGIETVATAIPPVTTEVANPVAENPYDNMFGGQYFASTPYSGISYYNAADNTMSNPPVYTFASGGEIMGPGTPTSDSVPAMLSDGEFVMNARAVRGAGGGDRQQGAKRMYEMMRSFERTA